jgi:hypothetical protein
VPNPSYTDLDTLAELFEATIEGITPRYVREQLQGWRSHQRRRLPQASPRWFRLVWDSDFETPDGIVFPFMIDTTCPLLIVTDYGGIPDQESTKVADSDNSQLREALHALCHTVGGLITVRKDEPPWEYVIENDGDQAQISHRLLIRYWKQR